MRGCLRSSGGTSTVFSYDDNGNLLSETTGTQARKYSWDADNRLRQVTMPAGVAHAYAYDTDGLRVEQITPTGTTRHLLEGSHVIAKLDAAGATLSSYLFHPRAVDEIVSFQQAGATYYPLTDALGTVYSIANAAGQVLLTYGYDVYGERSASDSRPQLAFGFTSREHDDSGLRYHRDRYVHELFGRWTQPDRAGMIDGPNFYQFVRTMPQGWTDPMGRSVSLAMGRAVGSETVEVLLESSGRIMDHADRQDGQLAEFLAEYAWTLHLWAISIGAILSVYGKKSNQVCRKTIVRRPWAVTREGTSQVVKHERFGKFYQHRTTKLWWSRDNAGHGDSSWKVYRKEGKRLVHVADADEYGDFITTKHKGPIGKNIDWSEFSGADFD